MGPIQLTYAAIVAMIPLLCFSARIEAAESDMIPIILDTDIGTDIDDAYALALLLADERCELLGVTTSAANAVDRAWMVCRFLTSQGRTMTPVAYGRDPQPKAQIDWQIQYRRHPAVVWDRTSKPVDESAEELMHRLLQEEEGKVVIVALGPLTNIARLLKKHPDSKDGISRIVLPAGSLTNGGRAPFKALAERPVRSDIASAQQVFDSGIPLVAAPLAATEVVGFDEAAQEKLFSAHTPLTLELESMEQLDERDERFAPVLFGPVAVRLALEPDFCRTQKVRLYVGDSGQLNVQLKKFNAVIANSIDGDEFRTWYVDKVAGVDESALPAAPKNRTKAIERRGLPRVVHAFEDYDNDIEKRWWMTGKLETKDLPKGSRRAQRAVLTQDYDDRMGDRRARYKAVIFNPVPGPPMGPNTRLSFRYKLSGTDTIRVQLFSLSNGYHRYLSLAGLPQDEWTEATVDMTEMRRPDGGGGPLAEDERIDDIQFYIDPRGELVIDEMILYDEAAEGENRPFPKRLLFTGVFDTGKQGAEWPGDFEIVPHDKPRTWKAAKSVANKETGKSWIRLHLRGERRLAPRTDLRFDYRLKGADQITVSLRNSRTKQQCVGTIIGLTPDKWGETAITFDVAAGEAEFTSADEIQFLLPEGAELQIDNLLLFEPSD